MRRTRPHGLSGTAAHRFACAVAVALFVSPAFTQAATPGSSPTKTDAKDSTAARLVAIGAVQAFYVTDLYAKDSGYVSQVTADIGDHVHAGQTMAVIDDPELREQYAKAQGAVAQADAGLLMAKRELDALEAELALENVTLKRQEDLFAGKALTDQQIDEARAKTRVAAANAEVGRAKIASAEADLRSAKAEEARLKALLAYTRIVAPFDAVVTRRAVNPGDLVQAATSTRTAALFTCQRLDVVRVFADVPEADAEAIHPGMPAEVRLYSEAGQRAIQASVSRIAEALDPATRTMRVEIDVRNPDGRLLPGMYAQVTFDRNTATAK